ncbi:MAG: hypothetical protein ACQEV7_00885 [Bacillota bacterium]
MNRMLREKEIDETVAYVVDRFLQAGLKYNHLLAITRTMTSDFGVSSEKEAEKLVKNYLTSLNHPSWHFDTPSYD